ncbi:aminoglycoside phosphotransferase family protein [Candidatus Parcubacteria bacterium]|jgi:serine/threonine protein kinase|nr:MAG: aminoglycoside phosphotransferase family protein [Candidatus Parcubacteria bacterium]
MNRPALLRHIQTILQARGLKPNASLNEVLGHHMRFFRTACQNAKGEKFTFKIYLLKRARTRKDFQNEIAFYHYASQARLRQFPRFVAGNRNSQHPWILYHFIPGVSFTAYLKKNKRPKPKLIKQLAQTMLAYGSLKLPARTKRQLRWNNSALDFAARFRSLISGSRKPVLLKYLRQNELEALARIIAFHKDADRRDLPVGLSHGDLSTNNLLVQPRGFAVLDWEHVQSASPAYDVAELWVKEFSKSPWRNQLVASLAKTQTDSQKFRWLFCVEVALFCLRDLLLHDRIWHELHSLQRKRIIKKLLNYYSRTYRAALRGFVALNKS